jgi:hypothetical protein
LKKLASIGFIAVLLLNVMGYYGVFLGMQYRNDVSSLKAFDADIYDESQAITLKIPVAIPYMTDNVDFQRVDGKYEHEGVHYRLVKQKYAQDTLTIVCVRDMETTRLSNALADYVKTFTDTPEQGQNSKISLNMIKDYLPQHFSLTNTAVGYEVDVVYNNSNISMIPSFCASVVHPPERA